MKNRMINKFRKKMLLLFFSIIGFSAVLTLVLYYVSSTYYQQSGTEPGTPLHVFRLIIGSVGDFQFFLIIFSALFLIFFWLITRKYGKPLDDVANGLSEIANGNFNFNIKNITGDEIGMLAESVNNAANRLRKAVEGGKFAESSKDRLIVSVAHDLRTPLTSITGYLELMLNKNGLTEDEARHYAQIAFNKSKRLEALIDELFELAKFNYGKIELNKERIDLCCLIEQINEEFLPAFSESNIQSRIAMKSRPVFVEADGILIARALENLISNAITYGKDGKFVDINIFSEEDRAYVQVVNYGSYIPEEEIAYIFESFYRMEKSRASSTGGSGLGLAIVKNIVDAHGGKVNVESSLEKTVFEIELEFLRN